MFQSNPELHDVRAAVRALKEQTWTVRRYAKEIRVGDRVYIWEADRKAKTRAHRAGPFAQDMMAFAGYRPRAKLRITETFDPMISRQNVVGHYQLASLMLLRCPRGTNFRV